MDKKYSAYIKKCTEMISPLENERLTLLAEEASGTLGEEFIPSALIVGFAANIGDMLALVSKTCGRGIGDILPKKLPKPLCVTFEHGEKTRIYRVSSEGTEEVAELSEAGEYIVSVNCSRLKTLRVTVCSNIAGTDEWRRILALHDSVCLCTYAGFAVNQPEREWLRDTLSRYSDAKFSEVFVTGTDTLHSEQDEKDVLEYISDTAKCIGFDYSVTADIKAAADFICSAADRYTPEELSDIRAARCVRAFLKDADRILEDCSQTGEADSAAIDKAVADLEAQRGFIVTSGEVASGIVLTNRVAEMRSEIQRSAEDFGRQASENIQTKIEFASEKELEGLESEIRSYLISCWDIFVKKTDQWISRGMDEIYEDLVKQIDSDIGELFSKIGKDSSAVISEAVCRHLPIRLGESVTGSVRRRSKDDPISEARRSTRDLILFSIPCAIVHPALGAATFVAAMLAASSAKKIAAAQYRKELASASEDASEECKLRIIEKINAALEDAKKESRDNIISLYKNAVDLIEAEIKALADDRAERAGKSELIAEIREKYIPQLLAEI
ncbi:MAG: hypothetical protein IK990_04040 [Ruminiclostridium sp.]|nr:hypothetical protein [Ruminiclostridium sp.]